MTEERPWQVGDEDQRWAGYLDPETGILRNLVGARTWDELREREDTLLEWRAAELTVNPVPQTFDLEHLQAIHQRLFQDVYPWAGETRTVDMGRPSGPMFLPHDQVPELWAGVATALREADHFRSLDLSRAKQGLAVFYDAVNTAHAFREGNGRTQRQFFNDLAGQAGFKVDWTSIHGMHNDVASQAAREGDIAPLRKMFDAIVTELPRQPEPPKSAGWQGVGSPTRAPHAAATERPPARSTYYGGPEQGLGR